MQIKLCDIIDKLGAEVINPAQEEIRIKGLASLSEAGPDELSFYHDGRYLNDLKSTNAAAVLVSSEFDEEVIHVIPQEYTIDGEDFIQDPKGMAGVKIEANFHIITAKVAMVAT